IGVEAIQLCSQSTLECGPRLAAMLVVFQGRELLQQPGVVEDAQHIRHHQVTRCECAFEIGLVAKRAGQKPQPVTDISFDLRPSFPGPGGISVEEIDAAQLLDRSLHRIERGEHPRYRASPCIARAWQQGFAIRGDVKDDRAAFVKQQITVLDGGCLPEGLACQMLWGSLFCAERHLLHGVRSLGFFERPAHAQGPHQRRCEIRNPGIGEQRDHRGRSFRAREKFAAYRACLLNRELHPPTWLSRIAVVENGDWWKVCSVRPLRSSNVTVTSVSRSRPESSSQLNVNTRRRLRSTSRMMPPMWKTPNSFAAMVAR